MEKNPVSARSLPFKNFERANFRKRANRYLPMCYLFTAQSQVHILFNFKVYYILNKSLLESLNFYLEIFCG